MFMYTFLLDRKPKLRPHVMYMQCVHQAEWISVCFDKKKKSAKNALTYFLNIYSNNISLINLKYMYDIEYKFKKAKK